VTSTTKTPSATLDPAMHAVILRTGSGWRALVASMNGPTPSIIDTADLPADPAKLRSYLSSRHVGQTLMIVPASRTIARTCTLPIAAEDQMLAALDLQLETMPAGDAPPHRIAGAVLPARSGAASRTGLMFVWPETAPIEVPALDGVVHFLPEAAALAALMADLPAEMPLLCLHPDSGDIALLLEHNNALRIRGTRESAGSLDQFRQATLRTVSETAMGAGMSTASIEHLTTHLSQELRQLDTTGPTLIVSDDLADSILRRLHGVTDRQWLRHGGILAGALLALSGPLSPLARLRDRVAIAKPSLAARTVAYLAQPRTAARAAALFLAILLLAPLGSTWLRLQILKIRFPDVAADRRQIDEVRMRLAMYETLGEEAWSMTKALGDVVTNAPRGIDIETIRLSTADRSFRIVGQVRNHENEQAPQIVSRMNANLNGTGMFSDITLGIGSGDAFGFYQFELNGKFPTAISPFRNVSYPVEQDFARWTLADRMSGKPAPEPVVAGRDDPAARAAETGPSSTERDLTLVSDPGGSRPDPRATDRPPTGSGRPTSSPETATDEGDEEAGTRHIDSRPRFGTDPGVESVGQGSRTPQANPNLIPEPITDAQVAVMSLEEATEQLKQISLARGRSEVSRDPDLSARLQAEFNLVMARLRELRQGGSNR